ncbi:MAG TPA: DUF5916 domain-containing protein [Ignavibacteriaceae bacterium]|nr:DUF5916 domain-containing protein [Ignavibacteriaceae bacterium]
MKNILILFTILILVSLSIQAQTKKLLLRKTDQQINVDGKIDPVWSTADSTSDFFQLSPYYDQPPTVKTVAKVLTTDDAIYALMICYDDEKNIQVFTGLQDAFAGDIVSIMLDTFGDNKTAYKLAVNASGVRADSRLLDDARNRDYNWDGIWFSGTKVYSWGFVVEWKIPYKSIQYDENLTEWGLDFDRYRPINSEDLYWNSYNKAEGQRISKFGKLVFEDFHPSVHGLNLEVYPVALTKATYLYDGKYKIDPEAGLDILYNPSPKLKFQLTANPDFAQIEADPFNFNISRYESFFDERRPFFTEGNEIFQASGRDRNTGFYRPLELFYSRRIGKILPGGSTVPLIVGAKAFGRFGDLEYGGFTAITGEEEYTDYNGNKQTEKKAYFGSARIKTNFSENSTIGALFVGKKTDTDTYGVIDVDGAFRTTKWQLSYQLARSIKNSEGDYAASAGFVNFGDSWINLARLRYVGQNFDINQVGYVPWTGTGEFSTLVGPIWRPDEGYIDQILLLGGFSITNKKFENNYTDKSLIIDFNMHFRDNWGYEISYSYGKSRDLGITYDSYELNLSSYFNVSPRWNGNLYGGYSKTYNFARNYLASYSWGGIYFNYKLLNTLEVGSSYDMFIEGKPGGGIEAITYNARPYFSLTPINNMNLRVYLDNVYLTETDHLERLLLGVLFSYNFSPKSWIYFAFNQQSDRRQEFDQLGTPLPQQMHLTDRVAVIKVKYLYYF